MSTLCQKSEVGREGNLLTLMKNENGWHAMKVSLARNSLKNGRHPGEVKLSLAMLVSKARGVGMPVASPSVSITPTAVELGDADVVFDGDVIAPENAIEDGTAVGIARVVVAKEKMRQRSKM